MSEPTEQDVANAAARAEIAARFRAQYDECTTWASQVFGPAWGPRYRHYLVDKEDEAQCRKTGERPTAVATVYSVRNDAGDQRHFMLRDGVPVEVPSYQAGFGAMLDERHPTMRIEVGGQAVAPHRFTLCWAGYETYQPKTADQLAAAREKRQEKAVEKTAEAMPLFAEEIREQQLRPKKCGKV